MRWRRASLVVLGWLVVLEGAAWVADGVWDFRYPLLDRLETAAQNAAPIGESDPDWPVGTLRVRVPDRGEAREAPYAIGGVVIEGAWPDAKQELITPADLDARPRVFVLGGSAAMGYPYAHDESFAEVLGRRLPGQRVVNAGQVGWASGQVVGVAQRILDDFEPAVLIVYSGNNEWIQWSPVSGGGLDPELERRLAHSRLLAGALYLGHGLGRRRHGNASEGSPLVGFEHALSHPDPTLDLGEWRAQRQSYLERFRANLEVIVERARERGARVVLMTVPFRYELSPSFRHGQPPSTRPEHEEAVTRGIEAAASAMEARDWERALGMVREAQELDDEPAILAYLEGVCLKELGRFERAEEAFARSRDRMVGNLGARLAINDVIREVAAASEASLVDLRRRFDDYEHARGRWLNEDLIHDDCHPTPEGHRVIADALAELLAASP